MSVFTVSSVTRKKHKERSAKRVVRWIIDTIVIRGTPLIISFPEGT